MQHIGRGHGAERTDFLDADFAVARVVGEHVDDGLRPVGAVAQQAQVAEGFLGAAEPALALAELVAEGDQEQAVAATLVLGQRQDARHVVALGRFFFFAEVADQVAAVRVARGHAVEEERVHVVVERFVVEKELAEQAEVAAPAPLPPPVDLEEGEVIVPVDFVARWVQQRALPPVPLKRPQRVRVAEAELADVCGFRSRK